MQRYLINNIVISILIISLFVAYDIQNQQRYIESKVRVELLSSAEGNLQLQEDPRVVRLRSFFKKFGSPLENNAEVFTEVADKYQIDYRLLPSIAMVESSGGKHTPSCARYNPFGWTSLTSPCGFWRFVSFDEAVRYVAKEISTSSYYSDFRKEGSIKELSESYNHGSKKWAGDVEFFLNQI